MKRRSLLFTLLAVSALGCTTEHPESIHVGHNPPIADDGSSYCFVGMD